MATTTSISNTYGLNTGGTSPDTINNGAQQTLTQQNFLQLLVAQMQNQDPTNPQSDTQMASQMAQFTSLTQTTAMSASLSMMQANSLIGSTVTVQTDSMGDTTSGVVQSVAMASASSGGQPQIKINGTAYNLNQVVGVAPTPVTTPATTSSAGSTSTAPTSGTTPTTSSTGTTTTTAP